MKLSVVWLLAAASVSSALAQAPPPEHQPRFVPMDSHCREARPGDTVTYSLTIEGLPTGQPVFADLQMRPVHELPFHGRGLPAPDFRNVGGGGSGQPNGGGQNSFDFSFVVPKEIFGGRYRGVEVLVRSSTPLDSAKASRYVQVSHHTMKRVHSFCLSVVSDYGAPEMRPEVIDFQPGAIVPK